MPYCRICQRDLPRHIGHQREPGRLIVHHALPDWLRGIGASDESIDFTTKLAERDKPWADFEEQVEAAYRRRLLSKLDDMTDSRDDEGWLAAVLEMRGFLGPPDSRYDVEPFGFLSVDAVVPDTETA